MKHHSSGKKVLVFLGLANVIYLLMIFVTIPQVMAFSNGMKLFDLMPAGYSHAYAVSLLDALGAEGRSAYLFRQLPLDMFYPILSGIAYCLLAGWLTNKLNLFDKAVVYLCFLPLVAGLFDYLENFGIIAMITSYPSLSTMQVAIVSAFSIIKSVLSVTFFTLLIVLLIVYLVKQSLTALKRT
ncbi:MAG: hypothetical protein ACOYNC_15190 [Bacteroidales bacterium]